ncbi:2-polyprenyl-6-methoxyphenol hydroxylase-like FAD-dependent oxidoreductase [Archangium gephyra]|uniref:2-polyprenyl-6-methoxyphenol hydroxylase n=1 Tax=Archangium gephyra TaxID=48 RepID=A0AAC8QGR1_9BACT|nr:FAD-dependent monooxygenase [Archangium gephyra]AKJ07104.1 2-polyprenyl-6-methoxyphenol hydroxylase [Archangium gephyra]REG26518.1 2-polyprenyl-6-methoxyphenol hydroxylase-like FAD-dependent oxidoreductase [Archangium gephyra]
MKKHVLITGASIAGPAMAWWLARHGLEVTVVERAREFRDGGQTIDLRGAGRTVVQRMGLEEAIRERTTHEEAVAFVDARNHVRARIGAEQFGGNGLVAELEILRGELARLLVEHSRDSVDYVFGDRIAALHDRGDKVEVRFEHGGGREFDLVIVAEGIGSSTRKLVFGDEVERVPLNLYTAYFTIPRGENDGNVARWFNAPGGRSVFLRPDNLGTTRAALSLQEKPRGYEKLPVEEQKALLKEKFADAGWETPRVLAALDAVKDFYFEAIGQVKMRRWSKGRVALLGDAAYCASPISGMGTSLALVGAYVLAGELARRDDHSEAFAAYERIMRPYVDQAQDVPKAGPRIAQPQTRVGIALLQGALSLATRPVFSKLAGKLLSPPADKIDLPDYGQSASSDS